MTRISACSVKGEKKIKPVRWNTSGATPTGAVEQKVWRCTPRSAVNLTQGVDIQHGCAGLKLPVPIYSFKKLDKAEEVKVSDTVSFYNLPFRRGVYQW